MRHIFVISLLLLAAATSARAEDGTFGFEDASLDVMPPTHAGFADLVSGSLVVEGDVVRATIDLAAFPDMPIGMAYLFLFSNGTTEFWAGSITAPSLEFAYGTWIADDEGPDEIHEAEGSFSAGSPGTITIEIPLHGLSGSYVLSSPRALAADIKGGAPGIGVGGSQFIVVDEASGEGELWLPTDAQGAASEPVENASERASAPGATDNDAPVSPPSQVPGFGATFALAALLGALVGARRSSR